MLRRRWLIVAVSVVVVAVVGLVAAALLIERPPFSFLAGQEPLAMSDAERHELTMYPSGDLLLYTFSGGIGELPSVSRELSTEGYRVSLQPGKFGDPPHAVLVAGRGNNSVIIYRD